MKKLLTIAVTGLVLSTSAFAGGSSIGSTEIRTDGFSTEAQAYEAGFDVAEELKSASQKELLFNVVKHNATNVTINDVEVSLEEFSAERGEISYRAVVDVDYSYSDSDS